MTYTELIRACFFAAAVLLALAWPVAKHLDERDKGLTRKDLFKD